MTVNYEVRLLILASVLVTVEAASEKAAAETAIQLIRPRIAREADVLTIHADSVR